MLLSLPLACVLCIGQVAALVTYAISSALEKVRSLMERYGSMFLLYAYVYAYAYVYVHVYVYVYVCICLWHMHIVIRFNRVAKQLTKTTCPFPSISGKRISK